MGPTWNSKDGRVRIRDMEDSHLINVIKFLERTTFMRVYGDGGSLADDMFYDAEEEDGTEHHSYVYLLREAVRRGLQIQ